MTRFRGPLVGLLLATALLIAACGGDEGDPTSTATPTNDVAPSGALGDPIARTANLSIHNAFVPEPPTDIAALYFTMVDLDGEGDRLMGLTTAAAGTAHFHASVTEGDTSRMLPVEGGIVLPPRGRTRLEPGGLHVMLLNLTDDLEAGDMIEVTLEFERAGTLTFEVPVQTYAEAAE